MEPQPNMVTLDSIRSLIQQELSTQGVLRNQHSHSTAQAPATNTAPLSPASFTAPLTVQDGYMLHLTSNVEPTQGLSHIVDYRKRQFLLPPVSERSSMTSKIFCLSTLIPCFQMPCMLQAPIPIIFYLN